MKMHEQTNADELTFLPHEVTDNMTLAWLAHFDLVLMQYQWSKA